ncbi:MAG: zinc ribbon domain-containing protein [Thermomicrobiales bacterium]
MRHGQPLAAAPETSLEPVCPECGKPIAVTDVVCPHCGISLAGG